mgnify:CR=1 FL=1
MLYYSPCSTSDVYTISKTRSTISANHYSTRTTHIPHIRTLLISILSLSNPTLLTDLLRSLSLQSCINTSMPNDYALLTL